MTEELKNSDKYKGTLANSATEFLDALEFVLDVYRKIERIYVYSSMKNDKILQIQPIKHCMPDLAVY